MKKLMIFVLAAITMIAAQVVNAQTMESFKYKEVERYQLNGSLGIPQLFIDKLAGMGITNQQDVANMALADSTTVAEICVRSKNLTLIGWVESYGELNAESQASIITYIANNYRVRDEAAQIAIGLIPEKYRYCTELKPFLLYTEKSLNSTQPARAVWNVQVKLGRASVEDAIKVLLADEPMLEAEANAYKNFIKDSATKLARKKLRDAGKSFVVSTNGVNPLVAVMAPIMTAINAPYMDGLEAAFLSEFNKTVNLQSRTALQAVAVARQAVINNGEVVGGDLLPLLPKLQVILGVDGYNAFITEYNNGVDGIKAVKAMEADAILNEEETNAVPSAVTNKVSK